MNIHDKIIKEAEEKISGFDKKMQELEEQNRKIFHPPPIEGIDIGGADGLEILDPEIRIPTEEDFVLPPPLESLLDKAKMAYKFLPKQGDIDRLIAKINKKVLRDTNLCVDLRDLKAAYLTSPHFRDIYLYLLQNRMPLGKGAAKRLDQKCKELFDPRWSIVQNIRKWRRKFRHSVVYSNFKSTYFVECISF